MRRRTDAFLPTLCLFLACAGSGLDLERILDRHAEARGGAQLIEDVRTLEVELEIAEPDFEATLVYRAMRPDRARVDVMVDGELVFTEAYDGNRAWQLSAGQAAPVEASPEGTGALRRGAMKNLYGLHELPGLGHRLDLLDPVEIDGVAHHPVRVAWKDGFESVVYLDADTLLITRERSESALHPDADPTRTRRESRHSDFREVGGLRWPFRSGEWDLDTGDRLQRTEIERLIVNPDLDPAIFEWPPSQS